MIELPEGIFAETTTLKPGQSVVLALSKMAFLHYVGNGTIDALNITLTAKQGDKSAESLKQVPEEKMSTTAVIAIVASSSLAGIGIIALIIKKFVIKI